MSTATNRKPGGATKASMQTLNTLVHKLDKLKKHIIHTNLYAVVFVGNEHTNCGHVCI